MASRSWSSVGYKQAFNWRCVFSRSGVRARTTPLLIEPRTCSAPGMSPCSLICSKNDPKRSSILSRLPN